MTVGTGKLFSTPPILIEGETEYEEHLSICMEPRCLVEFRDIDLDNKEHDLVQYGLEMLATRQHGELECGFQFKSGSEASLECISRFVDDLRKLINNQRESGEFCDEYGFTVRVEQCKPRILRSKFMLTAIAGYPSPDYWFEMSSWKRSDYLKGWGYVARVDMSCFVVLDEIKKLAESLSDLLKSCRDIQTP